MYIDVKAKDETTGEVKFEGALNRNEISFLLMYAINGLLADGVKFNLQDEEGDKEDPDIRFVYPSGGTLQ